MRPRSAGGGIALPPVGNASTFLALSVIVSSVVWYVLAENLGIVLYLMPGLVLGGQVWQVVTWLPATIGAGGVLFSALILWSTGGSLESYWGRKRFVGFVLGVGFLSGLFTVGVSMLLPALQGALYRGGEVLASIVWVGFGCAIWNGQTNIFGYPVSGRTFAMLGVLVTALNGVFSGLYLLVPEIFGIVLTFAYARLDFPGRTFERFNSWRLRRQLARRRAHLDVVSGDKRNMPTDSDRFLH